MLKSVLQAWTNNNRDSEFLCWQFFKIGFKTFRITDDQVWIIDKADESFNVWIFIVSCNIDNKLRIDLLLRQIITSLLYFDEDFLFLQDQVYF